MQLVGGYTVGNRPNQMGRHKRVETCIMEARQTSVDPRRPQQCVGLRDVWWPTSGGPSIGAGFCPEVPPVGLASQSEGKRPLLPGETNSAGQ